MATSGIPASRYRAAMSGATDSSVWNSMTRLHPLADQVLGVAHGHLGLVAVVHHDQLELLAPGRPRCRPASTSRGNELSCPWDAYPMR